MKKRTPYHMDETVYHRLENESPKLAVPWFLACSILYYKPELVGEDAPLSIISDECFDWLCKFALQHWDVCKEHPHSGFLCKEDLKAGSGYALAYDTLPMSLLGPTKWLVSDWRRRAAEQQTPRPRASKSSPVKTAAKRSRA